MSDIDRSKKPQASVLDAIVIVPGIMGSELVDGDGHQIWGLQPADAISAYFGDLLDRLRVTDEDLAGTRGVKATRLVRYPGIIGWFKGAESYSGLAAKVRDTAIDPRAVIEFPYDWRLSVASNGGRLARAAVDHWERWREVVMEEKLGDSSAVSLTVVAHSMGGLVTRAAQKLHGLDQIPLNVLTLGTPFYGSAKALRLLTTGKGAPLPGLNARKLQAFAVSSPGLHDLLPQYRCVTNGEDVRTLAPSDLATLGGRADAAVAARERWELLDLASGPGDAQWRSAVGVNQPTLQSVTIDAGEATFHEHLLGHDHAGDGTVYRGAAGPGWTGYSSTPVTQTHPALIATAESFAFVHDKLLRRDARPPLGTSHVSLRTPDVAQPGHPVTVRAARLVSDDDGLDCVADSHYLTVESENTATGQRTSWQGAQVVGDGWLEASHPGLAPGIHRVLVSGGGASPVADLLWVAADA
ncbi:Lecithin:cholesterol acyltransferase [Microbacterium sp. cf046]|uniref:lipase/acyltransferase domain-containing protein n=1 Tax=Microbacterium sp. cf046 TaxID=1761803 RepID=UPI0008E149C7|nr:hypothetical protein [Microbacterium sp. cf046]SFS14066.1 Lecithin:cholesterol acyltransferase [Microbacterium sp. cf046]